MIHRFSFIVFALFSLQVKAFSWNDLWYTPDQQAQYFMDKGQYLKAKESFERPDWAAAAAYRAGDYEQASKLFNELDTEQGYYNQGNALAHMGQYEQAIKAYDKALKYNPNNKDALSNRKLIQELLKKDQEQNKDQQNKDQQSKDQQNKKQQEQNKVDEQQQEGDTQSEEEQEKQQAKQQWLRLIPDDPGGLIREKFLRDHLRRERGWYQ